MKTLSVLFRTKKKTKMESKTSRTIYIMSEAELVETAIGVLEEVSLIFTLVSAKAVMIKCRQRLEVTAQDAPSRNWSNNLIHPHF